MSESGAAVSGPASLLSRTPLLNRVAATTTRLIILEAPAGYGKSTLARQIAVDAVQTGIVDALGIGDAHDYHRRLLAGLLVALSPKAAEDWERRAIELDDLDAWRQLCLKCWDAPAAPGYVLFENCEMLGAVPEAMATLAALFARPQPARRAIVCSRKPLTLHYGRFAFPHEVVRFTSDDLRFSTDELAALFELDADSDALQTIERVTQGWPMAALFVRRLRREGRLIERELAEGNHELFGFLSSEVLATLSQQAWSALFVLVALDDATSLDVEAALGTAAPSAIERLLAEAPFVNTYGEALQPHPLVRALVREQHSADVFRAGKLAAEGHLRAGRRLRAARIELGLGDPAAAAEAIDGMERSAWMATPSYELAEIMAGLDRDSLIAHPALWAATATARAKTISPQAWLHEGIEIWARHERTMSDATAVDVAAGIINACMNLGMRAQCEQWLELMRGRQPDSLIVSIWSTVIDAIFGRAVDVAAFERDVLAQLDGHPKALLLYDVVARIHRQLGQRDFEREASARALDISLKTKIPLGIAHTATDAAFGAWLAGEEGLYEEYISVAETHLTPSSGARFFLECARGYGSAARPGFEKLKTRAYGYLVAAAQAVGDERKELLRRGIEAADASSQPYARIITRCALGLSEPQMSGSVLAEARELADAVDSPPLRAAVDSLQHGGDGGMLSQLARRFRSRVRKHAFDIARGTISLDEEPVIIPDRQSELLTLLAVRGRYVHREELAETMWPDTERETALGALRTTISRLRAVPGLKNLVVTSTAGYALGADVSMELDAVRRAVAQVDAAKSSPVSESTRARLESAFEGLLERDRSRGVRWEWFGATERELEALTRRIGAILGRDALRSQNPERALAVGRRLVGYDPLDETARDLVIRALIALGDVTSARREVADFEAACSRELGVSEPADALRALLTTPFPAAALLP